MECYRDRGSGDHSFFTCPEKCPKSKCEDCFFMLEPEVDREFEDETEVQIGSLIFFQEEDLEKSFDFFLTMFQFALTEIN